MVFLKKLRLKHKPPGCRRGRKSHYFYVAYQKVIAFPPHPSVAALRFGNIVQSADTSCAFQLQKANAISAVTMCHHAADTNLHAFIPRLRASLVRKVLVFCRRLLQKQEGKHGAPHQR